MQASVDLVRLGKVNVGFPFFLKFLVADYLEKGQIDVKNHAIDIHGFDYSIFDANLISRLFLTKIFSTKFDKKTRQLKTGLKFSKTKTLQIDDYFSVPDSISRKTRGLWFS